jgi:hypothetical protein
MCILQKTKIIDSLFGSHLFIYLFFHLSSALENTSIYDKT